MSVKYYIATSEADLYEVTPLNQNVPLKTAYEVGQMYSRTTLETPLVFTGTDRDMLKQYFEADKCKEIVMLIFDDCTGVDTEIFRGYCTWYDMTVDDDNCTLEAKFSPRDPVKCILENKDAEVNILEVNDNVSITSSVFQVQYEEVWAGGRDSHEYNFCDSAFLTDDYVSFSAANVSRGNLSECQSIGCDASGCLYGFILDPTTGEPMSKGVRSFCYAGSSYPENPGSPPYAVPNFFIAETLWRHYKTVFQFHTTSGLTRWMHRKSFYRREVAFTKDVGGTITSPPGNGWVDLGYVCTGVKLEDIKTEFYPTKPLSSLQVGDDAVWKIPSEFYNSFKTKSGYRKWSRLYYNDYDLTFTRSGCGNDKGYVVFTAEPSFPPSETITYTNGRYLRDVIDKVIHDTCPSFTVASDLIDTLYCPLDGYTPNPWAYITVYQVSDIAKPTATEKASRAIMTFSTLTEMLRNMFQVYWFVEDYQVRFEHISYFYGWVDGYGSKKSTAFDLTTYEGGAFDRKKYSYDREGVPSIEKFMMMQAGNEDFIGVPITYEQLCSGSRGVQNVVEYSAANVMTDIWYAQANPATMPTEGFFMMVRGGCRPGELFWLRGKLSGNEIANAYLSWANLHDRYWKHDRPLPNGVMNNISTNFFAHKNIIIGEKLQLYLCCQSLGLNDMVKTSVGNGDISEMTLDLATKELFLQLNYGRTI
jgi:hypothetical protein